MSVAESGVGFVFLAVIVSYLPVLYQAFSRLEISIALLDARAGSPPTAGELLRRLAAGRSPSGAGPFLVEWERWAADLLESHISFPVLSYYRRSTKTSRGSARSRPSSTRPRCCWQAWTGRTATRPG